MFRAVCNASCYMHGVIMSVAPKMVDTNFILNDLFSNNLDAKYVNMSEFIHQLHALFKGDLLYLWSKQCNITAK